MPSAEIAYVALLRGVNVGGNKKVAMADLRDILADLGFKEPRSLLNSGNLTFRAAGTTGPALERQLEREINKRLGLQVDFFVRSAPEWAAIIAGNPFAEEAERDPGHLVVMCLKDAPPTHRVDALQASITGPELVRAHGTHAYITYPAGIGSSRLTNAVIDKALATRGTGRNWNTVMRLGLLTGPVRPMIPSPSPTRKPSRASR